MIPGRGSATGVLLALAFGARLSHAEQKCNAARSVDIAIELDPPSAATTHRLERQLAAELRARDLDVCRAKPGEQVLAHVRLRAIVPDLSQVMISVQLDDGSAPVDTPKGFAADAQALDLGALPPDARPLAIASTADELLRARLAESRTAAPEPEPEQPTVSPELQRPALRIEPELPTHPYLELGAAAVSTFFGHRSAFGGDLLGRWWPAPRVPLTARIGAAVALSESSELGQVQANDVHGGLGLGFSLVPAQATLGLSATATLRFARVSFDVTPAADAIARSGSAWATVASAGTEGWWRKGALCFSLGLAALLPLWPVRANAGGAELTSIAGIGAEVTAGAWFLLDRAPP
jgi:hypothetical protein